MSDIEQFSGEVYEPSVMGDVERALTSSIKAMDWLTPADDAAVEIAFHLARVIDGATKSGDVTLMMKAQNYGPHLKNVLNDLGGTPASRGVLGAVADSKPKESKVDELKRKRQQKRSAG